MQFGTRICFFHVRSATADSAEILRPAYTVYQAPEGLDPHPAVCYSLKLDGRVWSSDQGPWEIFSAFNSGNPREERVKAQNVRGGSLRSALHGNGHRQGAVSLFSQCRCSVLRLSN